MDLFFMYKPWCNSIKSSGIKKVKIQSMTKSMQLEVEVGLIGLRVTFLNMRWRYFR